MSKKILVADDDEDIVDLLGAALSAAGYEVVSAGYGSALPSLIRRERPDLMILDVFMPGLDGYSLQLDLSRDEATRELPLVVVTALPAARGLFEEAPQVRRFFEKPFDPEAVVAAVRDIVG